MVDIFILKLNTLDLYPVKFKRLKIRNVNIRREDWKVQRVIQPILKYKILK